MRIIKLIALLIMLQTSNLYSQSVIKFVQQEKDKNGNTYFVNLAAESKINATDNNMQALLKQLYYPNEHIIFKQIRNYYDNQKFTHFIYQAYYDDLEIKGMGYVIHTKDNNIQYANGQIFPIQNVSSKPSLSVEAAIDKMLIFYKKEFPEAIAKKGTFSQLVFCNNPIENSEKYFLAYKILIECNSLSDNYFLFADANSGEVISKEPILCTGYDKTKSPPNVAGSAQTRYSGTQNIVTDAFNSSFRLRETRGGINIITKNALNNDNELFILNSSTDFFDNNNTWIAAVQGNDQPATDVHWGAEKVLDYWQQVHGRNSIDGLGMPLRSYVHFGLNTDNAGWTGNNSVNIPNSMVYGDGNVLFKPLTSLDVCAHEFGHGICQFTAGLNYTYGTESSALNEGFSDIWGATVESYFAPAKQRWLIGEEVTLAFPGYLRSMSNPPSGAFSPSSDTYGDFRWNAQPDGHYRSGVLNKWYYLLSDGGSGTNGIGNTYFVNGITITKAANIAYMTEQNLFSGDNYLQARTISLQVTRNFYGINSCEEIAVTNAWYAVGVGAAYVSNALQTIVGGANYLCLNDVSSYTLDFPITAGSTIQFPAGISYQVLSYTNTTVVIKSIGSGFEKIKAVVTTQCGAQANIFSRVINFIPSSISFSYSSEDCNPRVSAYKGIIDPVPGATNVQWYVKDKTLASNPYVLKASGPTYWEFNNVLSIGKKYDIKLVVTTPCGTYTLYELNLLGYKCPSGPYTKMQLKNLEDFAKELLSTNESEIKTIVLSKQSEKITVNKIDNIPFFTAQLINEIGNIFEIKEYQNGTKQAYFNISNLVTGIYFIRIWDGKQWKVESFFKGNN